MEDKKHSFMDQLNLLIVGVVKCKYNTANIILWHLGNSGWHYTHCIMFKRRKSW